MYEKSQTSIEKNSTVTRVLTPGGPVNNTNDDRCPQASFHRERINHHVRQLSWYSPLRVKINATSLFWSSVDARRSTEWAVQISDDINSNQDDFGENGS